MDAVRILFCSALAMIACLFQGASLRGEEPAEKPADTRFAETARLYAIRPLKDDRTYDRQELELLRWSNPLRTTSAGTMFVWTDGGRPVVIASMYRYGDDPYTKIDHEFVSLSEAGLRADYAGRVVWAPREAGVRWTAIEKSPTPAPARTTRLTQMRLLANRFEGMLTKNDGDRERLRLLTQPIYRYPESASRDGAIFSFAQATDPEILLLIESDPSASPPVYRYAVARMSSMVLSLNYDGKTIWEIEKWAWGSTEPDQPYLTRINVTRPGATP